MVNYQLHPMSNQTFLCILSVFTKMHFVKFFFCGIIEQWSILYCLTDKVIFSATIAITWDLCSYDFIDIKILRQYWTLFYKTINIKRALKETSSLFPAQWLLFNGLKKSLVCLCCPLGLFSWLHLHWQQNITKSQLRATLLKCSI